MKLKINRSNFLFLFLILIYVAGRILRSEKIIIPWINSYLSDVLCLPIILSLIQFLIQKYIIRNPGYRLGIYHIILTIVYFSLVFEWYLPKHNPHFTYDPLDILAYSLGGVLFYGYNRFAMKGREEI